MTRLYHSPSSLDSGDVDSGSCLRAWAYRYIAHLKDPAIPWADIESGKCRVLKYQEVPPKTDEYVCSLRQKSLSFGIEGHATLERWYNDDPSPGWLSTPGRVVQSGVHLLPALPCPSGAGNWVLTEDPIGDVPRVWTRAVPATLEFDGVLFGGYKDLVGGVIGSDVVWLYDYKFVSDWKWQKKPEVLLNDIAQAVYAYDIMRRWEVNTVPCRWVYFNKKQEQARPSDTVRGISEVEEVLRRACSIAKRLDRIESIEQAPPNPEACERFGGCSYHYSAGGPCNARKPIGLSLLNNRKRVEIEMSATVDTNKLAALQQQLAVRQAQIAGAPQPTPAAPPAVAPAAPPVVPPAAPPVAATAAAPAPAPKPRAPRAPKAAPVDVPAEPPPVPAAPLGDINSVLELNSQLAEVNEQLAEARGTLSEQADALTAAQQTFDAAFGNVDALEDKARALMASIRTACGGA